MSRWDVIIVGAGISGLATGALLANAGKKVLVLERAGFIGGRMVSVDYKGHILDNGMHAFSSVGNLEEIFSRINKVYPDTIYAKSSEVYYQGKWCDFKQLLRPGELKEIMAEIAQASYQELEKLDEMSLREWISKKSNDEATQLLFYYLGFGASVGNQYEAISAGDILTYIKQHLDKGKGLGQTLYSLKVDPSTITQSLADVIKAKGGEVRTNMRVSNVIIENGIVRGIEIEAEKKLFPAQLVELETIEAPVVVSTLPVWDLLNIVSKNKLPRWYVDWVEEIQHKVCYVYSLWFGLDAPLWEETTTRFIANLPASARPCAGYHMPGYGKRVNQHQLAFWIQGNYDEMPNLFESEKAEVKEQVRRIFASFEKDIQELFPEMEKHRLWTLRSAAIYGIALTPGASGLRRVSMEPPGIRNLYLVSDTIRESRGLGMQANSGVALECAGRILQVLGS